MHLGGISARAYVLVSCALAVVEERSEATAVEVIQDCQQQALVELKGRRELKGEKTNETVQIGGRLLRYERRADTQCNFDQVCLRCTGLENKHVNKSRTRSPV